MLRGPVEPALLKIHQTQQPQRHRRRLRAGRERVQFRDRRVVFLGSQEQHGVVQHVRRTRIRFDHRQRFRERHRRFPRENACPPIRHDQFVPRIGRRIRRRCSPGRRGIRRRGLGASPSGAAPESLLAAAGAASISSAAAKLLTAALGSSARIAANPWSLAAPCDFGNASASRSAAWRAPKMLSVWPNSTSRSANSTSVPRGEVESTMRYCSAASAMRSSSSAACAAARCASSDVGATWIQ